MDADRFHIEAKAAAPVTDDAVLDAMLRNLLAERFHLVLHRETREMRALVLEWTPEGDRPKPDGPPDLMTAIREQLGLQLESKRAPVQVLIVDHAEKPGEN
jgi:hypothetical protein